MSSSHCSSNRESAEYWCDTKMKVHEVKYVWTIDNFDFHEAAGSDLNSPTFSTADNQVKWFLNLKPNGESDRNNETVSLYVCLSSESTIDDMKKKVYAKYSLAALNVHQNKVGYTGSIDLADINEFKFPTCVDEIAGWGEEEFLIKGADFSKSVLSNNKLTITCTLIYSFVCNALSNDVHQYIVAPLYRNKLVCNLVENFGMLLENQKFSDIVLSTKNKEYQAHKTILAARSSVFAAMFEHNFEENQTNRIEIEDMNEEVVGEMLRFIYTGKCENAEKFADGLLAAADKYDLERLKMVCAEALHKTLSVDNAVNILALADLHSVQELKSETIKFIVARFSEVVMSTAWKNVLMSNPELIGEVCKAVASRSTASNKRKNQDTSPTSKRNRIE